MTGCVKIIVPFRAPVEEAAGNEIVPEAVNGIAPVEVMVKLESGLMTKLAVVIVALLLSVNVAA